MSLQLESTAWVVIVAAHAVSTWFLVGLIWTIQLVHYPSFSAIASEGYGGFQRSHMTAMGRLVGLPWLIEGLSVLAVFAFAPTTTIRLIAIVGGLLETAVIAVTLLASIPAHDALTAGYDEAAHQRLLRTNWYRTVAWSGRGVLAAILVVLL